MRKGANSMHVKEALPGQDAEGPQVVTMLSRSVGPVMGLRIVGRMRVEDYHHLRPLFLERIKRYGRLRLLFDAEQMTGWAGLASFIEDARTMLRVRKHLERVAVLSRKDWKRWLAAISEPFIGGRVQLFDLGAEESAWVWVLDGVDPA
jgi:hypothetical protein